MTPAVHDGSQDARSTREAIRILFVAMVNSVHTARWLEVLSGQSWDIHVFPSMDALPHPALHDITIHDARELRRAPFVVKGKHGRGVVLGEAKTWPIPSGVQLANMAWRWSKRARGAPLEKERAERLAQTIGRCKPDIVHSLETQSAGYLVLEAKAKLGERFPPWIHTPWGSDIYLFGRLSEHKNRIRGVLEQCDYYGPKSQRDIDLAKQFGFKGRLLPMLPGNGGIDLRGPMQRQEKEQTSKRRHILLKGYHGLMNRAQVGLRALALAAAHLGEYRIGIYSATDYVATNAELVASEYGLSIDIISSCSHEEMLRLHSQARISIGISISDGVPNSMLEAMAMGAFPIESSTSCAGEWIVDGENGLIVPPEDPSTIADAICRAVMDDTMVDRAATINENLIGSRYDAETIRRTAIEMYKLVGASQGDLLRH